jgi:hypothetical protein
MADRELEIKRGEKTEKIVAGSMHDSSISYEIFKYNSM